MCDWYTVWLLRAAAAARLLLLYPAAVVMGSHQLIDQNFDGGESG